MPRGRGRVRWGLLAAGALGLVGAGAAQEPRYSLQNAPAYAEPVPSAAARPAVRTDPARRDEMQVELAWLSDPALFSFRLAACTNGRRLEAHGCVPNQAVRARALAVARAHSRLYVVDALTVYPGLTLRPGGEPPATVQAKAAQVLAEQLGPRVAGLRVSAGQDGRVTVEGTVRSLEDRWKASRCLREVWGCTCVENRLELAGTQTANRRPVVPAPQPTVAQRRPPQSPSPAAPVAKTPPPAPAVLQTSAPPAWSGPPAEATKPSLSVVPPGIPLYLLPTPGALPPEEVARSCPRPDIEPAAPMPAIAVPVSVADAHPGAETASHRPTALPTTASVLLVKHEEPAPQAVPTPQSAPQTEKPLTPHPAARQEKGGAGYVSSGTILLAEARPEREAGAREAAGAETRGGSYVAAGAILLNQDRPTAVTTAAAADAATQVQQRIRAACGPAARNLMVVPHSANALEVRFTAHDQAEADQLSAKMLVIPELLKYQLSFQVRIEP